MTRNRNKVNAWQRLAAATYGDGDYKHIADGKTWTELRGDLDHCGDTLFKGLMIELATSEDCDSHQEALRRIEQIYSDIEHVRRALCAKIEGA